MRDKLSNFFGKKVGQGVKKGTILSFIGQGGGSLFVFLFQIFAGRWLGVEKYGLLNVLYSAIFLVAVFIIAGIKQGLTRYIAYYDARDSREGLQISLQTSFLFYIILFSISIIVAIVFRRVIIQRFFNGSTLIYIEFLIGVFFISFYRFMNGVLHGYRRFYLFSFGKATKELLMFLSLYVIVRVLAFSEFVAGWSIIIAPLIISFFLLYVARDLIPPLKTLKIREMDFSIVKFILISGFINLMTQWVVRAGPILLKAIEGGARGDYHAGLFTAIIMPLNLVRTGVLALLIALYPNLTRAYSLKNQDMIRRYVFKSSAIVSGIVVTLIAVYHFFGPEIVGLLYPKEYVVSTVDATLLAFVMSFFMLALLLSKIIMARGTPRYSAISFLVGIIGMFSVLFFVDLKPMKLVEVSLLTCNFLYFLIQAIYLSTVKIKRKFTAHQSG